MNNNLFGLVFMFGILMMAISCSSDDKEEQILATEAQLIGEWRSSNTLINGAPLEDFTGTVFNVSNIFGMKEDGNYYFNYNSGGWSLEGNTIILENERNLKILKFDDDLMTLEAEVFANQTFFELEGIEENEKVTIQEDFRRQ